MLTNETYDVFVLGATGFVGGAVVDAAFARRACGRRLGAVRGQAAALAAAWRPRQRRRRRFRLPGSSST